MAQFTDPAAMERATRQILGDRLQDAQRQVAETMWSNANSQWQQTAVALLESICSGMRKMLTLVRHPGEIPVAQPQLGGYPQRVVAWLRSSPSPRGVLDEAARGAGATLEFALGTIMGFVVLVQIVLLYVVVLMGVVVFTALYVWATAVASIRVLFTWSGGPEAMRIKVTDVIAASAKSMLDALWGWTGAMQDQILAVPPRPRGVPDLTTVLTERIAPQNEFDNLLGRALVEAVELSRALNVPEDSVRATERVMEAEKADRAAEQEATTRAYEEEMGVAWIMVTFRVLQGLILPAAFLAKSGACAAQSLLKALQIKCPFADELAPSIAGGLDKLGSLVELAEAAFTLTRSLGSLEFIRETSIARLKLLYKREEVGP